MKNRVEQLAKADFKILFKNTENLAMYFTESCSNEPKFLIMA